MKLKISGVVKHKGAWRRPGDEFETDDVIGKDLIEKGVAVEIEKTAAEKEAEEQEAAAAKSAAKAERELKSLRKKAADLGIDGTDEKDAETLKAEIEAKAKE